MVVLTSALARHLATIPGLGLVYDAPGGNVFLEELPALPRDAVALVFKTAPSGDFTTTRLSGVAVLVRWAGAGRARAGYQQAIRIRDQLHGLRHITVAAGGWDQTRLVSLRLDGSDEPTNLGDDTNGVPRWSMRFLAETTTPDTGLSIL